MPLVVPGLSSTGSEDKTSGWMNKLAGKTLGDSSNETVRNATQRSLVLQSRHCQGSNPYSMWNFAFLAVFGLRESQTEIETEIETDDVYWGGVQTFAKTELPKEHRVVKEGDMVSLDHKPERYVALFFLLPPIAFACRPRKGRAW